MYSTTAALVRNEVATSERVSSCIKLEICSTFVELVREKSETLGERPILTPIEPRPAKVESKPPSIEARCIVSETITGLVLNIEEYIQNVSNEKNSARTIKKPKIQFQ